MKHVLLIETSATLRHAAKKLLENNGFGVIEANSFTKGISCIANVENATEFDAVCLGWPNKTDDIADELFASLDESQFKHLGVVVLTHEADSAKLAWVTNRSKTALVLWDNHAEIINALNSLTDKKIPVSTWEPVASDNTPVRVLFVDDSPTVRVTYRRLLTQAGYITDTASCVEEGFEKASTNNYDIGIIDYYMPDGTGEQLCRMLRDDPRTSAITTAIITGTYSDKAIIGSLQAGAVECMFKNEAKELFLTRIDAMSRSINAMRNIQNDHKRLEGILSSVGDGVYGVNCEGEITFINPAAKSILGYNDSQKLIGQLAFTLFHTAVEDDCAAASIENCELQKAYRNGTQLISWATNFMHADGKVIPVECTVYPLHLDGKLHGSVVAFRDVTERKLLLEELKWQATHDPLTKLPNRSYFESALVHEVKDVRENESDSCLLYLDLDRFKYLNDTAGHNAGDKLLVAVGKQLLSALRTGDSLARIGGDEFAIIMRNIKPDLVFAGADKFREVLDNYRFDFGGKTYNINVSIGVAHINTKSKSSGEVLANADIACYIAKGKGRNQTHVFASENDQKAAMDIELGWSQRLHDALEKNLFVLHYQPIVPLVDLNISNLPQEDGVLWQQLASRPNVSSVKQYEVLIRLPDSRGELICPEAFLPTAERFNMMPSIDKWVIRNSIESLSMEHTKGKNICLSINLSGQSLEDESLAAYIHNLVKQYGVYPQSLLFEITETSAIANMEVANRFISSLQDLGYKFALDDFGSGFCSFSHLKYLPVNEIKIDGIFIQGMLHDSVDRAIIESIVQIAHTVGKKTVAEFVENAEVLKLLKEAGVDFVQGYYVGKPTESMFVDKSAVKKAAG